MLKKIGLYVLGAVVAPVPTITGHKGLRYESSLVP
jgi:hypothetical protein